MYLAHVAPDNTMPVTGYEHRTLACSECGDIEQRLAFAGDPAPPAEMPPPKRASAEPQSTTEPSAKAAPTQERSAGEAETPERETAARTAEVPAQHAAVESGAQDRGGGQAEGLAAHKDAPLAKWARVVEKVRTRQTTLSQPPAPQKTVQASAEAPAAAEAEGASDFDRMWDEGILPRPRTPRQVPPRVASPAPRLGVEALVARVRDALHRPSGKPGAILARAAETTPPPARSKAPSKLAAFRPSTPRSRWARAIATLRNWQDKASRIEENDTILQIDAEALEVKPRRRIDRS
jgi:hypothetical protein